MTIAEDTTNSPALVVSSGATTTTAAFTPPNAGCILVCFMFGDANTGAADETLTASDSLSGTWSTPVLDNARGGAAVAISWCAVAAGTAASMTVSVTDNKGSVAKGNFTRIFTGTDLTTPFGATGVAGTSNISLLSTVTNSWCWSALLTSNVLQVAGANTTQKAEFGGFDGGDSIGVYASTNTTATAGTTITLAETGGTPVHNVAIELLPPAGGATINASVAFAAAAVLAAAAVRTAVSVVAFGAGAQLAAAATQTGFSTVAFGAGAVMTPTAFGTVLPGVGFAASAVRAAASGRTVLPTVGFTAGAQLAAGVAQTGFPAAAFAARAVLFATAMAGLQPLTPTVLVAGGAAGSTLVPSGAAGATLIASGAATGTLVAGGV